MITFKCNLCGKFFKVSENLSGKKGKCPKCNHVFIIPMKQAQPPEAESSHQVSEITDALQQLASTQETSHDQSQNFPHAVHPLRRPKKTKKQPLYMTLSGFIMLSVGGIGFLILSVILTPEPDAATGLLCHSSFILFCGGFLLTVVGLLVWIIESLMKMKK